MNPEWFLVLAPVAGIGAFLLASLWPTEVDHEVPMRSVRIQRSHADDPAPRLPAAPVLTPTTEERGSEMSDTSDRFNRSVALDKALDFWGRRHRDPALVLETAEKFRAFLSGEDAKPEPFKAKPEYVYFKYKGVSSVKIFYRSRLGTDAFSPESLERLTTGGWRPSNTPGNPKTFGEILSRSPEYVKATPDEIHPDYR